ncbi:MAG: ABC transporter ATP-binding protein [Gemmataceae bacterium]
MSDHVIEVTGLSRHFGKSAALDAVSLRVPRGCVLGLVGVNGSGKTTLLRHLLGGYRAEAGTVRVFGKDPVADPVGVLSRLGYLSDDVDIPNWMRIDQLLRYTAAFYPGWDHGFARKLCDDFGLDPGMKVYSLSRGMKVRAGLVSVIAHRPELLILDEPSAGLDPIARRDILQTIIEAAAGDGRTVLFSSHLLDEVERVADRIALVDRGRIVFDGPLDEVRGRHRRLTLRFAEAVARPPALNGVLSWEGGGREWVAVVQGELDRPAGAEVLEDVAVGLGDVFAAHAGRKP